MCRSCSTGARLCETVALSWLYGHVLLRGGPVIPQIVQDEHEDCRLTQLEPWWWASVMSRLKVGRAQTNRKCVGEMP